MAPWIEPKPIAYRAREHYPANPAPPRRFCKNDQPHDRHVHEGVEGLIWACYGHNRKAPS